MVVFERVKKEDLEILERKGFQKEKGKNEYELLRLRKGKAVLVLYTSGKLVLQGKGREKEEVKEELKELGFEESKQVRFREEEGIVIGSDEALKGDTFGGIVVAAVKADDAVRKELKELGARDSKKLNDKEVLKLAEKIRKIAECEVRNIFPEEYNKGKMTNWLNKLHKECYEYLKPGKHVVDKYPGCKVGEVQEEKAEEKYVEVAAASILARAGALQQLKVLSKKAGFELPKGSVLVRSALEKLRKKGLNFKEFVKLDFKNVKEFLS